MDKYTFITRIQAKLVYKIQSIKNIVSYIKKKKKKNRQQKAQFKNVYKKNAILSFNILFNLPKNISYILYKILCLIIIN